MSRARWVVAGGVSGLVLGLGLAAVVVWPDGDAADDELSHEEASSAFVRAWERSRTEEFVVLSTSHRETAMGGELDAEQELVQRPPDYLVRQFGSVDGRVDDRPVTCQPDPDGLLRCDLADTELEPYDEQIASEVETLEGYFEGEHPLYRVSVDGEGCFDLHLTRVFPAPPYGEYARFCFDDATGARIYKEVRQAEGTDVVEAVEIRTDVSDADFAL